MSNFLAKLLSLLLWLFFWFSIVVSKQNISEYKQELDITIVNLAEDQQLSTGLPTIKIKIDAPSDVLSSLDITDFKATIDAKWLMNWEFEKEINLSLQNTKARIVSFSPKIAKFTLEWFWKKSVPVKLNLLWKVAPWYNIVSSAIKERYVSINAANSVLKNTNEVIIDYELNWEISNISKKVKPLIKDKDGNVLQVGFTPNFLNLNIELEQIKMTKILGINPVFIWSLWDGLKISSIIIEPPLLSIIWDKKYLKDLVALDTEDIDYSDLKLWRKIYSRKIIFPNEIEAREDQIVRIIIELEKIDI